MDTARERERQREREGEEEKRPSLSPSLSTLSQRARRQALAHPIRASRMERMRPFGQWWRGLHVQAEGRLVLRRWRKKGAEREGGREEAEKTSGRRDGGVGWQEEAAEKGGCIKS